MNIPFVTVIIYVIICGHNSEAIINGTRANKRYMVYLLSSPNTYQPAPSDWLCGGAIITPKHIITAGACIVQYWELVWVIAGYNKYVDLNNIRNDRCTSRYKKSLKRVHFEAHFPHHIFHKWNYTIDWFQSDISIAEVDTPYNFHDVSYLKYCTHIPNAIKMSFRGESYEAGSDAVVFGWGSSKYYRPETYSVNLNQPYMLGTSVRIVSMKGCQKIEGQIELKGGKNHFDWFHRYAICTMGQGDVDVDGNYVGYQAGRDNLKKSEMPDYKMIDKLFNDKEYMRNLKPNGFCQNDHGGPLVTWMGGVEYLIGIASTFFVNAENMQCIPPFRYTSVRLTSRYINCSLSASSRRSSLGDCDTSIVLERNDAPIGQTHEP